ncbi:MAG: hypothetical protein M5U28_17370 [Sandaracinaceae bacterium]|nr:hypothetical protein [Sandaracinaceae bacterium]
MQTTDPWSGSTSPASPRTPPAAVLVEAQDEVDAGPRGLGLPRYRLAAGGGAHPSRP